VATVLPIRPGCDAHFRCGQWEFGRQAQKRAADDNAEGLLLTPQFVAGVLFDRGAGERLGDANAHQRGFVDIVLLLVRSIP